MYAVLETGGKQYRVAVGEMVNVEKLPVEIGETITLDRVLLVAGDDDVRVGLPVVEGVQVRATVIDQDKARKVIVFKYHQKNRYRRKNGHRQAFTRLRIDGIVLPGEQNTEEQPAEAEAEVEGEAPASLEE